LETLTDLDSSLKKLGSRLVVVQGKPTEILPELFKEWKVNKLFFEKDSEPFAIARDKEVLAKAKTMGIETVITHGHTLYDLDVVLGKAKGNLTTSYQGFQKLLASCPAPAKPVPAPTKEEMPAISLAADLLKARGGHDSSAFDVPTLESLGYKKEDATTPFKGGETVALDSFEKSMARKAWVAKFEKPETPPTALQPSTTALSPHLKFGSLSCRLFYWRLMDIYKEQKGHSQPPVSLEGQLLWREFFYCQSYAVPNFDRMVGNPVCKQIPWDHNPEFVSAWENGKTGYPWIDAAMTQLKQEGWLHHLARHAVACFLTRGDLYQSWEVGAKIFDRLLLDSDWALNQGNWQWLSASAYFYQFFRVYSPVQFPKKTDPNGDYVRKYLPQFKDFPAQYIYEPWKAPKAVQEKHGVVVGVSYPARIVDHEVVSKRNIERHAKAYAGNKEGGASIPRPPAGGVSGIGATQVGSDPVAAQAYFARAAAASGAEGAAGVAVSSYSSSSSSGGAGAGVGAKSKRRDDEDGDSDDSSDGGAAKAGKKASEPPSAKKARK
jgi:cryptochrome